MKGTGIAFTVIGVLVCLAITVGLVVVNWQITNEINGWKTRAQVSSEPNDMLRYMSSVKEGMERWEMTQGHAALIWRTPENDMGEIFKTVLNHVDQAEVLTLMDRSSPEYQTGLDNLRGSIRELELHTKEYWNRHQGLIIWIGFWISLILFIAGVIIWGSDPGY